MNFHSAHLGFRAKALHLRLYAVARIRGLRTRQNVGNEKFAKLSHNFEPIAAVNPYTQGLADWERRERRH